MSNIDNIENLICDLKTYEMELLNHKTLNKPEIAVSPRFEIKIKKLIKKLEIHNQLVEMRRVAVAILITTVLLTAVLRPQMYVQAAKWVFEQCIDHFHVQFKNNSSVGKIPDYELTYIPKGYKMVEKLSTDGQGAMIMYTNDEGKSIDFEYEYSDASININNEGVQYHEYIDHHARKIYYLEATTAESSSMTWLSQDGEVVFTLFAQENKDEMQKIVDGTKEK